MKGLESLGRTLLFAVVLWLVLPALWQWLGNLMPFICGLLALVVVVRVLLGKGVKP